MPPYCDNDDHGGGGDNDDNGGGGGGGDDGCGGCGVGGVLVRMLMMTCIWLIMSRGVESIGHF